MPSPLTDRPTRTARALVAVLVLAATLGLAPALADELVGTDEPSEVPSTTVPPESVPPETVPPESVAPETTVPSVDDTAEPPAPAPPLDAADVGSGPETYDDDASIDITKTALDDEIFAGQDTGFEIVVTNTGDFTIYDIEVDDPLTPECESPGETVLDPDESDTYYCNAYAVQDSDDGLADGLFTNTASVSGYYSPYDDYGSGEFSCGECDELVEGGPSSDSVVVTPFDPSVSIAKTALTPSIFERDDAIFEITVTNTGNVDLFDGEVLDDFVGDCETTIDDLAVGDSVTYECTSYYVFDSDEDVNGGIDDDLFTNEASVEFCALEVVWEGEGSDCVEYVGDGSEPAEVELRTRVPGVSITKTALVDEVFEGGTAPFEIEVTNTGDWPLFDIEVADDLTDDCARDIALGESDLEPGDSTSYTCYAYDVEDLDDDVEDGLFTNSAEVEAHYNDCGECKESISAGPAEDFVTIVPFEPEVSITKTALTESIIEGEDATFEITVTNTGNVPLDDVEVTDEWAWDCENDIGSLAVEDSVTYQCTAYGVGDDADGIVDEQFTNVAVVTGVAAAPACDVIAAAPEGSAEDYEICEVEVDDEDDAVVVLVPFAPDISITKTALDDEVLSGDDVDFEIEVTNTGNVVLDPVTVDDPLVADCDVSSDAGVALEPLESITYKCTVTDISGVGDDDESNRVFTNVATAYGQVNVGPCGDGEDEAGTLVEEIDCEVSDTDQAEVTLVDPSVRITKTALSASVLSGGATQFLITVLNSGDVALSGLSVADLRTPNCVRSGLSLTPGQTAAYTCTAVNVTDGSDGVTDARFTNVAEVRGTYRSRSLSDTDDAAVAVTSPPSPPGPPPPPGEDPPVIIPVEITPIIVLDPPTTDPPPVEPPEAEEDPDDPNPVITLVTGEDTTLLAGGTILLEGPDPGCALSVLIDGDLVAAQNASDDPLTFSFLVGTDGLGAGRHLATVQCADGTVVFERPFTLVFPVSNSSGATGAAAFIVVLVMLLGWRFIISSGANQDS